MKIGVEEKAESGDGVVGQHRGSAGKGHMAAGGADVQLRFA